jgi:hypothetical protein
LERALKSFAKYQITSYLYLAYFHTPHTKDGMTNFYVFYFHADALGGHPIGSPPPFFSRNLISSPKHRQGIVSGSTAKAMGNRSHVCAHADPLALVFSTSCIPSGGKGAPVTVAAASFLRVFFLCTTRRRWCRIPSMSPCPKPAEGERQEPEVHSTDNVTRIQNHFSVLLKHGLAKRTRRYNYLHMNN